MVKASLPRGRGLKPTAGGVDNYNHTPETELRTLSEHEHPYHSQFGQMP
jgi:hypothetical protein